MYWRCFEVLKSKGTVRMCKFWTVFFFYRKNDRVKVGDKNRMRRFNKIREKLYKYSCVCLCAVLIFSLSLIPVAAKQSESKVTKTEKKKRKVVKVGWYEDSYHITGSNGERSGYGYEYEQAVASYTGWDYQYIKGDWSELLEKLKKGEIDLMCAISYTKERAKTMLFSELPMGEEKYYLYADLTNPEISPSDLSTLNGKRIVTMKKSVQATQFSKWEKKNKIKTKHINLDSF